MLVPVREMIDPVVPKKKERDILLTIGVEVLM